MPVETRAVDERRYGESRSGGVGLVDVTWPKSTGRGAAWLIPGCRCGERRGELTRLVETRTVDVGRRNQAGRGLDR